MDELTALRFAASGEADYATDRYLTQLGHAGLWELKQVGEKRITPYVAQGNVTVDTWGVFRSKLTAAGEKRLGELERVGPTT